VQFPVLEALKMTLSVLVGTVSVDQLLAVVQLPGPLAIHVMVAACETPLTKNDPTTKININTIFFMRS
jgi:hypothetical protein